MAQVSEVLNKYLLDQAMQHRQAQLDQLAKIKQEEDLAREAAAQKAQQAYYEAQAKAQSENTAGLAEQRQNANALKIISQLTPEQQLTPDTAAQLRSGGYGSSLETGTGMQPTIPTLDVNVGPLATGTGPQTPTAPGIVAGMPSVNAQMPVTRFAGTPQQQAEIHRQNAESVLAQQLFSETDPVKRQTAMQAALRAGMPYAQVKSIVDAAAGPVPKVEKPQGNVWRMTREGHLQYIDPMTGNPLPSPPAGVRYNKEVDTIESQPAPSSAGGIGSDLVKVEHQDENGRAVIEWIPKSLLQGQIFKKTIGQTVESRLASAEAVIQTGDDLIAKLKDPQCAAAVGPVLGRYNNLREFIGNPPPEFRELAGQFESYSLANMGVHGMRSAQGAEMIKKMLEGKQTPESLIAAIKGLNAFGEHFMANEGRKPTQPVTTPVETPYQRFQRIQRGGK